MAVTDSGKAECIATEIRNEYTVRIGYTTNQTVYSKNSVCRIKIRLHCNRPNNVNEIRSSIREKVHEKYGSPTIEKCEGGYVQFTT